MIHMREYNAFEEMNVKFLVNKQIEYATIQITQTGYKKSILDTTVPVRTYFLEKGVHDFEKQPKGQEHKKMVESCILTETGIVETQASLYRPETKDGDPRMWVYKLKDYVNPDDIFAIIAFRGCLYIINLTQIDIEKAYLSGLVNPIQDLIKSLYGIATTISEELLGLIRDRMSDWVPTKVLADTGVGREVEAQLGIPMNPSKKPDYKGIELKSHREKAKVRSTLFTKVPNWALSRLKNTKAIVAQYGYIPEGYTHKSLHVTLRATQPNPQGLGLNVNYDKAWLEANEYDLTPCNDGSYKKVNDVSVWQLVDLHNMLVSKHHETFWIDVDTQIVNNREYFRVMTIDHTKNPIPSQFDILLEQGKITVDFLLQRDSGGDVFSFKMDSSNRVLLFPENAIYIINEKV